MPSANVLETGTGKGITIGGRYWALNPATITGTGTPSSGGGGGGGGNTSLDGFTPGLYYPSTIWWSYDLGTVFIPLASGFVRGMAGIPVWSLSGTDSSRFTLSATGSLHGAIGIYQQAPATWSITVSVTNGVTTYSKNVSVVNLATGSQLVVWANNTVYDSALAYGYPLTPNARQVSGYNSLIMTAGTTLIDPAGMFAIDVGNAEVVTTEAAYPLANHYGAYPVTFATPNGTHYATTFYILHEAAPTLSWAQTANIYDNSPVGQVVGTLTAYDETARYSYSLTTNPGGAFAISGSGVVTLATSVIAGTAGFTATVVDGSLSTALPVTISVGTGTTLSPSNMTASFSSSLDNSMTGGTVGTVTVTGISSPTWLLYVLNDEVQSLTSYPSYAPMPRYTITAGAGATATVTFDHLSAQTDALQIVAINATGTRCTQTFNLTVAAKSGPTHSVGDGAGYDFPSIDSALSAYWGDPITYAGMTLQLYPRANNYSNDFQHTSAGHGGAQAFPPGPITYQGMGSPRTKIDLQGGTAVGAKGCIIQNSFDVTAINLEICNVSNALATGEPNGAAFYVENQTFGNFTISGCYVHNCDDGFLNGDVGKHVTVTNTIFAQCGTGYLAHNFYCGHASSLTATNVQSFSTAYIHLMKSRAARSTISNCKFLSGLNDQGSSCLDFSNGGVVSVSNCTFMKSANPNNDTNIIQWAFEPTNPALWTVNTLSVTGCTFYNLVPPGVQAGGNGVGIATYIDTNPATGNALTSSFANCSFYNLSKSFWTLAEFGASLKATDGGGNASLTTFTAQTIIDPLTSAALAVAPFPAFYSGNTSSSEPAIMAPPLSMQAAVASSPSIGTAVVTLNAYDISGIALTSVTWTLPSNPGSRFAISSGGAITVAANGIADGLYWVQAQCVGMTSSAGSLTLAKYVPIIVGTGYVAAS